MKLIIRLHFIPQVYFYSIKIGPIQLEGILMLTLKYNYQSSTLYKNLKLVPTQLVQALALLDLHYTYH